MDGEERREGLLGNDNGSDWPLLCTVSSLTGVDDDVDAVRESKKSWSDEAAVVLGPDCFCRDSSS